MAKDEYRSCVVGVNQIINVWENMNDGNPYFAVFYSSTRGKYFQYNRNDLEGAKSFLENNLGALAQDGDNALYYLNIYDEEKKNYNNSNAVASFPFRLNKYEPSNSVSGPGYGPSGDIYKMLQDAHAKELEMTKTIAAMQAENQPLDAWDRIGGLLETPGVAQALIPILQPVIGAIMGAITKFSGLPQMQMPASQQPHLAGPPVSDDINEQIDLALDRLEKHANIVEMLTLLANFADKNPAMFTSYLEMLKTQ